MFTQFAVFIPRRSVYERGQKQLYQKQMPDKYVKIGRLCAVLYQHAWHRATIVDILECSVKVRLLFITTIQSEWI